MRCCYAPSVRPSVCLSHAHLGQKAVHFRPDIWLLQNTIIGNLMLEWKSNSPVSNDCIVTGSGRNGLDLENFTSIVRIWRRIELQLLLKTRIENHSLPIICHHHRCRIIIRKDRTRSSFRPICERLTAIGGGISCRTRRWAMPFYLLLMFLLAYYRKSNNTAATIRLNGALLVMNLSRCCRQHHQPHLTVSAANCMPHSCSYNYIRNWFSLCCWHASEFMPVLLKLTHPAWSAVQRLLVIRN